MKQDKKWELILYPDSSSYDCSEVLASLVGLFDQWAYILHDSDVDADGNPKKPHYHFYGKCSDKLTSSGIAYRVHVPESACRVVSKWKSAVRYTVHADNPEKYQYNVSDICSNFPLAGFFYRLRRYTGRSYFCFHNRYILYFCNYFDCVGYSKWLLFRFASWFCYFFSVAS